MIEGINQLRRYANLRNLRDSEGCEKLFHYNQVMISTHRGGARFGTITSPIEHYLEWKDPYPLKSIDIGESPSPQQLLIQGLLTPKNFLDIIQNFTVFETENGHTIKKIARYQQFRAVHKTIKRLKIPRDRKSKGGVIWHTQGSGKSLTMVFLTQKIRRDPFLRDHKLVFLTDRTQLDGQLTATFRRSQGETVLHAKSASHLRELLAKDASDLITSTIQKFVDATGVASAGLNESERIIVLADEGHRTQYGQLGGAINAALPNATKIAFTGTPLITSQKTTNEFGAYIDIYTIEQAVTDGATVQILYEGREAHTKVTGDSLDALFNHYFQDKTLEEKNAIKKKYGTDKAVLEAPQRIEWVAQDLVDHYRSHILPNGFKAMIVTSSRKAAITYKKKLDSIPNAPESAVIISSKDNNDPPDWQQWTSSDNHKKAIENFKKSMDENPLSILIVKDMLLTGFDAPICGVMYLDRKLTDHNLLQAIARVNRTEKQKFSGYIVDYFGLTDYLEEALQIFSSTDVQGALKSLKDEIPKLQAAHTIVKQHLKGANLEDIDSCISLLEDELKRQQFETDFRTFAKQMEIVLPHPAANRFCADLKALGEIVIGCRNRYRDEQLNIAGCGEKVRRLIEEHVCATGIDIRIPPTKLFDRKFGQVVASQTNDRAKASEVEHAIKAYIKVNFDDDPEYYQSLSNRLAEIIQQCENRWGELVKQLLLFRDKMESEKDQQNSDLGLSEKEGSFYRILIAEVTQAVGDGEIDEKTHQQILNLTKEIFAYLQKETQIVGFFDKWNEVRRVKLKIKRSILDQPFGSKKLVDAVTGRWMDLAKVKFQ